VYDGNPTAGNNPLSSFQAFTGANNSAPIHVAAKDVEDTGNCQVFVIQGSVSLSDYNVRLFRPLTHQLIDEVFAGDPGFAGCGLNLG